MEWITDPTIWVGLVTLVVLEIVLGVDNLIFIAILAGRLPARTRDRARVIGLSMALVLRLALLASISWVMSLTANVFSVWEHGFSWRDLILIGGGLFLLVKATLEIHDRLEVPVPGGPAPAAARFWPVVAQIIVLDVVFSLDSVITAVGMVEELYVMMAAVIIAVLVMLFASKPLGAFVTQRPSLIILCLGFLLMIGLVLVADGLGVHVPKTYVYAAIGFSVLIEMLNQLADRNRRRAAAAVSPRRRAAYAILRLVGGVPPLQAEAAAGGTDVHHDPPKEEVFAPLERRMMRGVLELSRRPVTTIMTHRATVDWIDASAGRDAIAARARASRYRVLPVSDRSLDNLRGVARKEDLLAVAANPDGRSSLDEVLREPVVLPATTTVLRALEMFKRAPIELAVVVDEYGGVMGVVTRTDLLEAIAGDLPEHVGEAPEIEQLPDGTLSLDGALPVTDLQDRLHLETLPEGSYQTAAGMVLVLLGRVPHRGDAVEWRDWKLEVTEMEGLGIRRLLARRVALADPSG